MLNKILTLRLLNPTYKRKRLHLVISKKKILKKKSLKTKIR